MASALPIPTSIADIDCAWITAALDLSGRDEAPTAITVTAIGTGQMATSLRVDLHRHEPAATSPQSVVVKMASADPNSRAAGARGAYLREVRYYEQLDHALAVNTPRALWAGIDVETSDFALVLEDMRPASQGDQVTGCSAEQARLAAQNIAGLHAPRWCDATLFDIDWLATPASQRSAAAAEAQQIMGLLTEGFIARYAPRLTPEHVELLRWFAARTDAWIDRDADPFSLTHADHRLDNLLFGPDPDRPVTVVDWQTVGIRNPMTDVSYLVGTGLPTALRREAEHDIVAAYHRRLVELGVRDYSFDRCFDDYRLESLHALLITVLGSMMTGQTDRGDDMFMAMLSRSAQQIFDLEARDRFDRGR